jgi:hypothetical protein
MARIALIDEPNMLGLVANYCGYIGQGLRAHVREHTTIGAFEPNAFFKLVLDPPIFI